MYGRVMHLALNASRSQMAVQRIALRVAHHIQMPGM